VAPAGTCNNTCSDGVSLCGGPGHSISAYDFVSLDATTLTISAQNFLGDDLADTALNKVKTGETVYLTITLGVFVCSNFIACEERINRFVKKLHCAQYLTLGFPTPYEHPNH
jgi:hypothetical protein